MRHLLVIDEDTKFRGMLVDYLSQHAFRVTGARDYDQAELILAKEQIDLTLVDLNLRQEDGLGVVRKLFGKSAIIIMSEDRLDEADKVAGLELGASDYIAKHCGPRELVARVRAALRTRPILERRDIRCYSFDAWVLNVKLRQLTYDGKIKVKLTVREFNLLLAFVMAPRQVLSREQLLSASRVHTEAVFDRCIDVLVLRLRRKLELAPSDPKFIRTERGVGYTLDADVALEGRGA